MLFPPGLLLLCEAVCVGVLADPHGPICELSGNGFVQLVLLVAGCCSGRGSDLWDRVTISCAASFGKLCSLLVKESLQSLLESHILHSMLLQQTRSERRWKVLEEDDSCSLGSKRKHTGEEQKENEPFLAKMAALGEVSTSKPEVLRFH